MVTVPVYATPRDPTRDGWMKEFIKRKRSSGLFWAVGAAEKKQKTTLNCHNYTTFEGDFFYFLWTKIDSTFFKYPSIRTEKLHNLNLKDV